MNRWFSPLFWRPFRSVAATLAARTLFSRRCMPPNLGRPRLGGLPGGLAGCGQLSPHAELVGSMANGLLRGDVEGLSRLSRARGTAAAGRHPSGIGPQLPSGYRCLRGGFGESGRPVNLTDVENVTTCGKTPDRDVFGGLLARVRDRDHYYALEFSGSNLLRLVKVQDNPAGNPRHSRRPRDRLSETGGGELVDVVSGLRRHADRPDLRRSRCRAGPRRCPQ